MCIIFAMDSTAEIEHPSRKLRANVVINLIRTLTMTLLSFLTFPYVTRALGDQVFGLYTWANTFVYYFLILAKISIPNIAIRECAKVKDDKVALSHKAQEFFILQCITTILSFGLLSLLCFTVPSLRETNSLIFLLSINFLTGVYSFEWIYVTLEKHFYVTVRSILIIAVTASMTFLFIKPTAYPMNEIYIYALITVSVTILTVICNLFFLRRHISLKKTAPYNFKPYLKPLFTFFLISAFLTVYNQTDSFLLGYLDPSKSSVGAYSVGVKGIDIIITLTTSLYVVFMPRAHYYHDKPNKKFYINLLRYSFNITFFIAIPAIATMATMSTPITALISGSSDAVAGQYNDANLVLAILSIMMLTYSICDSIYTQILLPSKNERHYLIAMGGGVILNVGGSLLLGLLAFRDRPIIGVAIATAATDVLMLVYLMAVTWKYSSKAIIQWNTLKILIAGSLVAVFAYFFSPFFSNVLLNEGLELWQAYLFSLIVTTAISAVIYIGSLLLMREHLISLMLSKKKESVEE